MVKEVRRLGLRCWCFLSIQLQTSLWKYTDTHPSLPKPFDQLDKLHYWSQLCFHVRSSYEYLNHSYECITYSLWRYLTTLHLFSNLNWITNLINWVCRQLYLMCFPQLQKVIFKSAPGWTKIVAQFFWRNLSFLVYWSVYHFDLSIIWSLRALLVTFLWFHMITDLFTK